MKRSTLLLTALTLLFTAQFIRVLLPSLIWYLQEVLGVGLLQSVWIWYGPFVAALALPLLAGWLKPRVAIWAAGAGVIVCRLILEQAWTAQIINIWAAIAGIAFCVGLLPLLYGHALAEASDGAWTFIAGLLLGLSLDTAVRGLTGTLDLTWVHGIWPRLAVLVLVAAFAYALWRATRNPVDLTAPGFVASLPLLGMGLALFAEWLILQNQGWVETFTGWSPAIALSWIMLGNLGALLAGGVVLSSARLRSMRGWPVEAGAALSLALAFAASPGWIAAVTVMLGLVSAGVLLAVIVANGQRPPASSGFAGASIAIWLGLLLFATLVTIYSISLAVQLPFPTFALAPAASVGLTVCALGAAGRRPRDPVPLTSAWAPARLGALLLLAPASVLIAGAWPAPAPVRAEGFPVRIMTYNIRDGYGMGGRQDLEAIAQVIESAGTDVVGLEEIGRGTLFDNGADVLALLSRRLNMPYWVMENATDPLFGDAILSRYPILAGGQVTLPRLNALIVRGYAWAQIDLGSGNSLLVLTTHLDSGAGAKGSAERVVETQALLADWAVRPRTVVLGDMNSTFDSPEMQVLLAGGLIDTWAEAGQGQRPAIDWIFHTPDLAASEVHMIESPASDHFAVVATLAPKP